MIRKIHFLNAAGLAVVILAAVALTACSSGEQNPQTSPITSAAQTLIVQAKDVPAHYVTSGNVTSDHRVSISSRLSGYIREMAVREGDQVKSGQVLVRVDPVDARQNLIQARADLANAEADAQRYNELLKAGAVTSQQAAKVMLRYKVAKSQVEQAKNQLSYAEVRSPVDGVVVEKRLSQGDLAAPGVPILTLEDPSSLLVETYVSEQYVSGIHTGDIVDVDISSLLRSYQGVVRQVVQAADPVSHQFLVKTALPVASEIHPGMFAQAAFRIGQRKMLQIPELAVIARSGLHAVYVVDAKGIAHYRQLRLGQASGGLIEVLAGLHAGDVIAWNGKPELQSGMKVEPVAATPSEVPAAAGH